MVDRAYLAWISACTAELSIRTIQLGGDALTYLPPNAGAGAWASVRMIEFHALTMGGGVRYAVENCKSPDEAAAAFRYFGLYDVASFIADVAAEPNSVEEYETKANQQYATLVPSDDTLEVAFCTSFREHPEAFTPL